MEINILGNKVRLEIIIVCVLFGWIISSYLMCSCSKVSMKEGLEMMGSPLNWRTGNGVIGDTWDTPVSKKDSSYKSWYGKLDGNVGGKVPLPEGEMSLFYANKFDPKCCYKPQQYSNSSGCACISSEQMQYLNQRGGNRTHPSDF